MKNEDPDNLCCKMSESRAGSAPGWTPWYMAAGKEERNGICGCIGLLFNVGVVADAKADDCAGGD